MKATQSLPLHRGAAPEEAAPSLRGPRNRIVRAGAHLERARRAAVTAACGQAAYARRMTMIMRHLLVDGEND